jgi:hypothetical protein
MKLRITCVDCKGTGADEHPAGVWVNGVYVPSVPGQCVRCGGTGYEREDILTTEEVNEAKIAAAEAKISADLSIALATVGANKYFPAWIVLDCVNATEYAALVDAAKDGLRIILSVGVLFLGTGSKQLANLRAIFPSGVTRTALDALVA